ncbi:HNH endonuclease [Bacillus sp. ISL-77]|uniref:HNH endonuclease n=1 Tax=Bacillus sp. ISL-77 TaxID=2819138 RepID=UPI001BE50ECA|nr:HNH endonuclease [Bacillus sp. ISL-77]MBT2740543.1 HNH endonuclease [Bacillus sp. ISL-77]
MATWLEDTIAALINLGGVSPYQALYDEIERIRKEPLPPNWKASVRRTIETYSSDSEVFNGKRDFFYSVEGLSSGIWGLRGVNESKIATDIGEPALPTRSGTTVYRILRDTALARNIKNLHNHRCQICGDRLELISGEFYSEAHHIKPLGTPHNGPDVAENIIVLCPNHHVLCDYGAVQIDATLIHNVKGHTISNEYINYHNSKIYNKN